MEQSVTASEIGKLLSGHGAALELYASQWTNQPEDCVQEAFIALAQQRKRPDQLVAWLYRVVRNQAINASRSSRRRLNHERLASLLVQHSPADLVEALEEKTVLATALEQIGEQHRELIVLRIWSQMPWRQIAELTQTSKSSAQRNYVVALQCLKEILESCPKNSNCQTR